MGSDVALADALGGMTAFFLTLFVLSYALGDNFLFRLALALFVGISAGIVCAAAFYSIIWPQLLRPLIFGSFDERLIILVPLLLSLLLSFKAWPRLSFIGSFVMAFLVGVGAATVIGGSLIGTLFPQFQATINLFDFRLMQAAGGDSFVMIINSGLILVGLVAILASFQFGTRSSKLAAINQIWKPIFWIGRIFIAITLGVVFAGVYIAALTALVDRFQFFIQFIRSFAL